MSIPLVVNGVTFQYPVQGDKNWGPVLTSWSSAVTAGMLQKAGGSFPLTAAVDFGAAFGMKVLTITSEETNPALTGFLRLGNASAGLVWRNAANSADLPLTVNASNQLTFNGVSVGATTSLTNGHILVGNVSNQPADVAMSGDVTITNAGVTSLGAGKVLDANVSGTAAIALTKLASTTAYNWYVANTSGVLTPQAVTASRAVATDVNGLPVAAATTATELGYVGGVTSAIQTQLNARLPLSGGTMAGAINMGSNKIQSVANGTASGDAVAFNQIKYFQTVQSTNAVVFSTTNTSFTTTNLFATITPTSASNRVKITVSGGMQCVAADTVFLTVANGITNLGPNSGFANLLNGGGSTMRVPVSFTFIDAPATTSAITYNVRIRGAGGGSVSFPSANAEQTVIVLEEIL